MNIEVAIEDWEMDVVKRVLSGCSSMLRGEISRDEWLNDEVRYPRKAWLYIESEERMPFVVVDNREGKCFVARFDTLDGAIFYACNVYLIGENQDTWDYPGAVKDRGNLKREDPVPCF